MSQGLLYRSTLRYYCLAIWKILRETDIVNCVLPFALYYARREILMVWKKAEPPTLESLEKVGEHGTSPVID